MATSMQVLGAGLMVARLSRLAVEDLASGLTRQQSRQRPKRVIERRIRLRVRIVCSVDRCRWPLRRLAVRTVVSRSSPHNNSGRPKAMTARRDELQHEIKTAHEPPPLLHPSMADLYKTKVEQLAAALQRKDSRLEASETLRGLIDSIVL